MGESHHDGGEWIAFPRQRDFAYERWAESSDCVIPGCLNRDAGIFMDGKPSVGRPLHVRDNTSAPDYSGGEVTNPSRATFGAASPDMQSAGNSQASAFWPNEGGGNYPSSPLERATQIPHRPYRGAGRDPKPKRLSRTVSGRSLSIHSSAIGEAAQTGLDVGGGSELVPESKGRAREVGGADIPERVGRLPNASSG